MNVLLKFKRKKFNMISPSPNVKREEKKHITQTFKMNKAD